MHGGLSEEASLNLGKIFPYASFLSLMGRSLSLGGLCSAMVVPNKFCLLVVVIGMFQVVLCFCRV